MVENKAMWVPSNAEEWSHSQRKEGLTTLLQTDRLSLRPLVREDIPLLTPLFRDSATTFFYLPGAWRLFEQDQVEGLLGDWHDAASNWIYVLCEQKSGSVIGQINLDGIDWIQRNLEIGIALLPEYRGLGYAYEALNCMLDYLFNQMNLHRITARIHAGNRPSLTLFERVGFVREGCLREQVYRSGSYLDQHLLGLLEEEYRSLERMSHAAESK